MERAIFLRKAARLADAGLVTAGLASLFVFAGFFYEYALSGHRRFSSPIYAVLYFVCPLVLSGFLFAALRFEPARRVTLLIFLTTSLISTYILELGVETTYAWTYASTRPLMIVLEDSSTKQKDAAALAARWGVDVDARSADEALSALRAVDPSAIPVVTPENDLFTDQPDGTIKSAISIDGHEVVPLAGISNRTTLLCNENGEWIHYRSDDRGFNNSGQIWLTDTLQIAALGDSFTHGYCVPPERSFVALIRNPYPLTLNLGIAGNGPLMMLATLREYVPRFKPPIVLWFYFEGNDLEDLQRERRTALTRYLDKTFRQGALSRQHDLDRAMIDQITRLTALGEQRRERRLAGRLRGRVQTFVQLAAIRTALGLVGGVEPDSINIADKPNMDVFRDTLTEAKASVAGWGGQLIVVYLPDWARYAGYRSPGVEQRDNVLSLIRSVGIPVIDLDPAFRATGDPLALFPFRRSGHYNETGHHLVAEEVLKAVARISR